MASSNAIPVVNAFIAAINRRDLDEISRLMSDDHTFIDPRGVATAGRETMTAGWRQFFQMFPRFEIEVESIGQAGDFIAVFGRSNCAYAGKRGPAANTFTMPAAWKAVVRGGKIKSWQVFADWTEGSSIIAEDGQSG